MTVDRVATFLGYRRIGNYTLVDKLGVGGMATVFKATNAFGEDVVLKMLRPRFAQEEKAKQRLRLEGLIQHKLEHPNIVRALDLVECDGVPGIVTEFVDGVDMVDAINRGRLDLVDAIALTQSVLLGLAHAHDHGVMHRDIKPENVMLDFSDDEPVARLIDFGIARIEGCDVNLTQPGEFYGTPSYCAPEQVSHGGQADERADLYSVGMLLRTILTGKRPFADHDTPVKVIFAIARGEQDPLPDTVCGDVREAIERATAVRPEERYQNAREFIAALDQVEIPFQPVETGVQREPPSAQRRQHEALAALMKDPSAKKRDVRVATWRAKKVKFGGAGSYLKTRDS